MKPPRLSVETQCNGICPASHRIAVMFVMSKCETESRLIEWLEKATVTLDLSEKTIGGHPDKAQRELIAVQARWQQHNATCPFAANKSPIDPGMIATRCG
jgi:hypothetical protein